MRGVLTSLAVMAAMVAVPAEARFGKSGGGGHSSSHSSGSSSHSSSAPGSSSHSATPVGEGSGSGVHYGDSYSGGGSYGYGYRGGYGYRPYWYGFYGTAFVPYYGYGWGYPAYTESPTVVSGGGEAQESAPIRVTAGVEAQGYLNGFTLGVAASLEGERWGFVAGGQNMALKKDDGTPGFDNLQAMSAHLTFALLTGQYGRLRVEGGADAVVAPELFVIGPTVGLSGVWWVGGPFALEGSAMYTPWPFTQVDGKAGLALGIGAVGLRAGWRFQLLDDQGRVDGVAHTDVINGPYVGLSVVF